jgi:surface polysaccharide O-acyltransferase-like enzyme
MWAVPVFFMITGALMLNKSKEYTVEKLLKKYALRIILALLLFGFPYAIIKNIGLGLTMNCELLWISFLDVLTGNSFRHLWYLYALLGVYFIMPVLFLFIKSAERVWVKYLLFVLFVLEFFVPMLNNFFSLHIAFRTPLTYPIFYVLFGFYIFHYKPIFWRNKSRNLFFVLLIIFMMGIINKLEIATWLSCNYNSPLIALLSMFIFSNFSVKEDAHINTKTLWSIDRMCFTVYLIHPFIMQFSYRVLHLNPSNYSLYPLATIVFATIFVLLSFIASYVIRLIPPLRKYVL